MTSSVTFDTIPIDSKKRKQYLMTRKDFQLIADVVKDLRNTPLYAEDLRNGETAIEAVTQELAHDFARALTEVNPRFNQALFLKACGVKS